MTPGFVFEALYYDCNPAVKEARLVPTAALMLLFFLAWLWRRRRPARQAGTPAPRRMERVAFAVLLAGLPLWLLAYLCLDARAWRVSLWWGSLATVGLFMLAVLVKESRLRLFAASTWRAAARARGNVSPAWCAFVTVLLLMALMASNGYLAWSPDEWMGRLHEAVRATSDAAFAQHDAARGYRGVTMGLTLLVTLATGWTVAGLWWRNRFLPYSGGVTLFIAAITLTVALLLAWLAATHALLGFGGAAGTTLLCAAWRRDDTPGMAFVTDAFNAIGFFLPMLLALGACLLMEPVGRPAPKGAGAVTHRLRKRIAAKSRARLDDIAERARSLDMLIYLGAVGLVFGTLQISATYTSALSHLPSPAEVKATADLCKTIGWSAAPPAGTGGGAGNDFAQRSGAVAWALVSACGKSADCVREAALVAAAATRAPEAPGASPSAGRKDAPAPFAALGCPALAEAQARADIGESAHRFARQTTLTFGIAFSAILLALYVPAALLLHAAAGEIARTGLGLTDGIARNELLAKLGIESDYIGKLGRLIAALSPLVAGLLTSALSGA